MTSTLFPHPSASSWQGLDPRLLLIMVAAPLAHPEGRDETFDGVRTCCGERMAARPNAPELEARTTHFGVTWHHDKRQLG